MTGSTRRLKFLLLASAAVLALVPTLVAQTVRVFASGFNNPRGRKFGPDGNLYVAEGGTGGMASTQGTCTQVPAPIGPYTGEFTARISKVAPDGTVSTVADNLPSSMTSALSGNLTSGVAGVAFLHG